MHFTISKLVSGGQTGAERAALDWAFANDVPHGGWCPAGRRAEDGIIPAQYQLQETPSAEYAQCTAWNVRDSDLTLIITETEVAQGSSALTIQLAQMQAKPYLHNADAIILQAVLERQQSMTINITGQRASEAPGIYARVYRLLDEIFPKR